MRAGFFGVTRIVTPWGMASTVMSVSAWMIGQNPDYPARCGCRRGSETAPGTRCPWCGGPARASRSGSPHRDPPTDRQLDTLGRQRHLRDRAGHRARAVLHQVRLRAGHALAGIPTSGCAGRGDVSVEHAAAARHVTRETTIGMGRMLPSLRRTCQRGSHPAPQSAHDPHEPRDPARRARSATVALRAELDLRGTDPGAPRTRALPRHERRDDEHPPQIVECVVLRCLARLTTVELADPRRARSTTRRACRDPRRAPARARCTRRAWSSLAPRRKVLAGRRGLLGGRPLDELLSSSGSAARHSSPGCPTLVSTS